MNEGKNDTIKAGVGFKVAMFGVLCIAGWLLYWIVWGEFSSPSAKFEAKRTFTIKEKTIACRSAKDIRRLADLSASENQDEYRKAFEATRSCMEFPADSTAHKKGYDAKYNANHVRFIGRTGTWWIDAANHTPPPTARLTPKEEKSETSANIPITIHEDIKILGCHDVDDYWMVESSRWRNSDDFKKNLRQRMTDGRCGRIASGRGVAIEIHATGVTEIRDSKGVKWYVNENTLKEIGAY